MFRGGRMIINNELIHKLISNKLELDCVDITLKQQTKSLFWARDYISGH